jgi:hypothetical protein
MGIWYHNIAVQTPVWVANRDTPVSDPSSSRLAITPDGNLALFDGTGSIAWSTKVNTSCWTGPKPKVLLVHVRPPANPIGDEAAVYEEEGSAFHGLYGSGQAAGSAPEGDEATVYEEGIFERRV